MKVLENLMIASLFIAHFSTGGWSDFIGGSVVSAASVDNFVEIETSYVSKVGRKVGHSLRSSAEGDTKKESFSEYPLDEMIHEGKPFKDISIADESGELLTSDMVRIGEAEEQGFTMHPDLVDFYDMIEDDEKFAIWEKEQMANPSTLVEVDNMNSRSRKSTSKPQKKWARKAVAKSEITSCWREKTWKTACKVKVCHRWEKHWWTFGLGWCADSSCANESDIEVLGCCHQHCGGYSDDGTSCTKPCASQSTTPYTCSHIQCADDGWGCASSALKMAFSIFDMLSSICPAGRLKTVAKQFAKAASRVARKAVLKSFAKGIAKSIYKKSKKKVKKFMKQQNKVIKEYAVDAILQEAAESIAYERARESEDFPSYEFEDVMRELDPIGVADVIDAFSLADCNSAELTVFPGCHYGYLAEYTYDNVFWNADWWCCGLVQDMGFYPEWGKFVVFCHYPYVPNDDESTFANFEHAVDDITDDDGFYSNPNVTYVDFVSDDYNVTLEVLLLCESCSHHAACLDNEVESSDLTLYKSCEAVGCCGDGPPDPSIKVPDLDLHVENVLKFIRKGQDGSPSEPDKCEKCSDFCEDTVNQNLYPRYYDMCISNNCCPDSE